MKASYQAMGFWLALFSCFWLAGGLFGTGWFTYRGKYAEAAIALVLVILVAGLWRRWPWVKIPLLVYWGITAAAAILLLLLRGWRGIDTLRLLSPLYFVYLVTRWHPENWPSQSTVV